MVQTKTIAVILLLTVIATVGATGMTGLLAQHVLATLHIKGPNPNAVEHACSGPPGPVDNDHPPFCR